MESRTQGLRSRPRTQTNFEAEDQGHRRKCSPKKKGFKKILAGILKKKVFKFFFRRKRSSKIFFQEISTRGKQKKDLRKFSARFLAFFIKILTVQHIVLSSTRGPGNFRGLEASTPRPGLENVSSRPRTSSRTPPLVAKLYYTYPHYVLW